MKTAFVIALFVAVSYATILFQEDFGEGWESRWVESNVKKSEGTAGEWIRTAGKWYNDEEKDQGIQTGEDARFYQLSAKFPEFSNKDKTLVIQYSVKHEQSLDCGGGYIKLLPPGLDQAAFEGDSDYNIMFGPDMCGSTKKTHAILNYKGENYLINKNVYPESDQLSHLYTFVLNADQSYEIWIDGEVKQEGTIFEDWDILPPKQINDPNESKPEDWVDEAKIVDPEAVKPEGWDDIPEEIEDPDAVKPEDWDDELDGDWEPPTMPNPEYKGPWQAPMIDNPDYKGIWEHPQIDNPDYFEDFEIYAYDHAFIGFELWQVKSGSIFDNILVTDSVDEARAFADGYFQELVEGEKKMKEEVDAKEAAEAQAAAEAEAEEAEDDEAEDDEAEVEEAAEETGAEDHGHDHAHADL